MLIDDPPDGTMEAGLVIDDCLDVLERGVLFQGGTDCDVLAGLGLQSPQEQERLLPVLPDPGENGLGELFLRQE